ncbi:MAG TPA: ABC transporter permease subunit, partial [Armatimonadota bacterium]|nr:ABC transporter permease subunit [Armatimonadota bacterium]
VTTVVVIVFGVPAAFALTRVGGRAGALADNLLAIPLVLPASSVGLALLVAFQWPPVLALQDAVGFRVAYSQAGIVVAQLVLAMAVGVRAWRAAFESVDRRQEQVARTLGSSPARAFFTVILPRPGMGSPPGSSWPGPVPWRSSVPCSSCAARSVGRRTFCRWRCCWTSTRERRNARWCSASRWPSPVRRPSICPRAARGARGIEPRGGLW